jgi:hypothetical protein
MDEKTIKTLAMAVGIFSIAVAANVMANSIYTHTKLGTDKKTAMISSVIGVGTVFILLKYTKSS